MGVAGKDSLKMAHKSMRRWLPAIIRYYLVLLVFTAVSDCYPLLAVITSWCRGNAGLISG